MTLLVHEPSGRRALLGPRSEQSAFAF